MRRLTLCSPWSPCCSPPERSSPGKSRLSGRRKSAHPGGERFCLLGRSPRARGVQGTAFFRTSIDINNNTNSNITVQYQFSYTCGPPAATRRTPSPDLSPERQPPAARRLPPGRFHRLLEHSKPLVAGAEQGCLGTPLLTFSNLPVQNPTGSEDRSHAPTTTWTRAPRARPRSVCLQRLPLFRVEGHDARRARPSATRRATRSRRKLRLNVGVRTH